MELVVMGIKVVIGLSIGFFLLKGFWSLTFGWLFEVQEKSAAVIELFGKFQSVRFKGLNFKPPFFWRIAGMVDLQLRDIVAEVASITQDTVPVEVMVRVQFRVKPNADSVYRWHYNMTDPVEQITSWINRAVLDFIAHNTVTDLFENTDELARIVTSNLELLLAEQAGAEIIKIVPEQIDLDQQVQDAMAKVKASERDREAASNQAAAMKVSVIAAAEAESESKRLQGEGIAALRLAVARGMKESLELTQEAGLGTDEAQRLMLVTLWADMLRDASNGSNSTVLMLPNGPDGLQATMQQLMATMTAGIDINKSNGEEPKTTTV